MGIDDDNEPAPDNIPTAEPTPNTNQTWGWDGIDHRQRMNVLDVSPTFNHGLLEQSNHLSNSALVSMFIRFFPSSYLENVILKATNEDIGDEPLVTFGELLRFIGIWFFLATTSGHGRREFWSTHPVVPRVGAPYRCQWMTRNRFEAILKALAFTCSEPPSYVDRFWEVRDLITEWNTNMTKKFGRVG
jgi:hypothetical protein